MIRDEIKKVLEQVVAGEEFFIDYVPKGKAGDVSTNVAMKIAARDGGDPMQVAQSIASRIQQGNDAIIERVIVYPPGYINMTLTADYLIKCFRESDRAQTRGQRLKVLVEFVSANPTGPINIVSARAAAFGDSLIKILNAFAFDAQAEYYVNDSGRQIELLAVSVEQRMMELAGKPMQIPDDGYHGTYLIDVAKQAVEKGLTQHDDIKKFALEYFVENHQHTLRSFGVTFDYWKRESVVREHGAVEQVLKSLKDKDLTFEQEGALYFRSTKFEDKRDRVIVTSDGRYTYLLPDIAYHLDKIKRGYDRLITVLGPDHAGQVPSLIGGIQAFGHPRDILKVIIVQQVKLKKDGIAVTMSKRAGTFTALNELLEKIPTDVARFFFLMRSCSQHLDFDLDLAMKDSEENPVYYVQYAHARIQSIIAHAEKRSTSLAADVDLSVLRETEEMALIKHAVRFPEIIEDAVRNLDPYPITYYLIELARLFHAFYQKHRVVCDEESLAQARLYLVQRTALVIKKGLELLGVSCPDHM
ncbi:MAG TPA: arginine--tRNA ligase [bacterium]